MSSSLVDLLNSPEFWVGTILAGLIINLVSSIIFQLIYKKYQLKMKEKSLIKKTFEERKESYIEERIKFIGKNSSRLNTQMNLVVFNQSSLRTLFLIGTIFYTCGFLLIFEHGKLEPDFVSTIAFILGITGVLAGHVALGFVIKVFYSSFVVQKRILQEALNANNFNTFNEFGLKNQIRKEIRSSQKNISGKKQP